MTLTTLISLFHVAVKPTLFEHEFTLADRVAMVSGGNRGLGLEMAMALAEAGARAVYCVDLPKQPGEEWTKVKDYLSRMEGKPGQRRLEYISTDVRDQVGLFHKFPEINCLRLLTSTGTNVEDWGDHRGQRRALGHLRRRSRHPQVHNGLS